MVSEDAVLQQEVSNILSSESYEIIPCRKELEEIVRGATEKQPGLIIMEAEAKASQAAELILQAYQALQDDSIPVLFLFPQFDPRIDWVNQMIGKYIYLLSKPYNPLAVSKIVNKLIETTRTVEAGRKEALERLARDETDVQAYILLSKALNTRWFNSRAAIAALEKAVALAPDNPEIRVEIANLLSTPNSYTKAVEHYLTAIRLRPNYADAYFKLGLVYEHLRDMERACAAWRQAVLYGDEVMKREVTTLVGSRCAE